MNYRLIDSCPKELGLTAQETVLYNRGIKTKKEMTKYMNTTDDDINSFMYFGIAPLKNAAAALITTINNDEDAIVIVDSDCDGYVSSSTLINYLYDLFPAWVQNHLTWFMHSGKQHGLSDFPIDKIDNPNLKLIICPDSSSNDYTYHQQLAEKGIKVIVLDHHEADRISEHAIIINNQLSGYPNKDLAGVGVTWQFCKYLDSFMGENYADKYLDLVALGLTADMMSLTSIETKHLINKGFDYEYLRNPFVFGMAKKNSFSLKGKVNSIGAAFYIAPFVNAMVRSGTQEEKELLFQSMLTFKAFEILPSTKRGHKPGETETLVEQALRVATNVKNRQTRAQDEGLEFLEKMIEEQNLLEHKVLLFLLEPGQIDRNIAGLIANKFMAKYQRPCCILTKVTERIGGEMIIPQVGPLPDEVEYVPVKTKISYQGSARGYDKSGITNFKDICAAAPGVMFAEGHQGAFGLGIEFGYEEEEHGAEVNGEYIIQFLEYTDEVLKDMDSEPTYLVDFIYNGENVPPQDILDVAHMDDFWGKDFDEPYIVIENLKITKDMFVVYKKKTNTAKFTLSNKVNLLLFNADDEFCELFENNACVTINVLGQCRENEWNGYVTPQIEIKDFEIVSTNKYLF